MSMPNNRLLNYGQALYEATQQAMQDDPRVFVMGLGVDDAKGIYGTTLNLHREFGNTRNFDTPIAEDGMTGVAIGAAMAGMRPIHVHQRMDFVLLCMNQLVNIAAKTHYMFAGELRVPLVVRAVIGRSWGQGAQHSQALHALFMHIPGLKVFAPTTPHDAKGCLLAAIRDDNPVIFMEHRMLYNFQGVVPQERYTVPFGQARRLTDGQHITVVGVSHTVVECLRAASALKQIGIEAEVIDPVSLAPLDMATIAASVAKTGHLLIVDNGWLPCGASAEMIAQLVEHLPIGTPLPTIRRMGFAFTPCPTTKPLEDIYYPTAKGIAEFAYQLLHGRNDWKAAIPVAKELEGFRGPF